MPNKIATVAPRPADETPSATHSSSRRCGKCGAFAPHSPTHSTRRWTAYCPTLLPEILARELQLAATDVRAIVAKTLERFGSERVLSIRVHPQALAALTGSPVAVVADAALADGDLMVELKSGTIDMTLKARVADLLDASLA